MSKHVRRSDLIAAGAKVTGPIEFNPNDLTSLNDRDNSHAIYMRLFGSNGFTVNESTSQGTNGHETEVEKQKKEERRRDSLSDLFDRLFPTGSVAALVKAAASASLASSFTGNATTEAPVESIKTEEILVSEEAYEVLHKETQDIEDYIAEYKAETDPEKRARMEMEIKDLAGYYKIKVDFDQKDGPQMFGHDYDHVLKLEEYFHGDNIPTAAECKNKVCVFHVLRHGHTGGLNNKTAPETAKPDDVDGIVGNDKQAVAVVTTPAAPPPPALHLH